MKQEYALYKGDKFLDIGTAEELADKFNVKPATIKWYSMPTNLRRIEKRKSYNGLVAVRL